jgi:hypothetical protein
MGSSTSGGRMTWLQVLGLLAATGAFSVVNPGLLVAVPLALLAAVLPPRRAVAVAVALGVGALAFLGEPYSGLWYVERAWALLLGGWFLALTLRWPGERFLPRGWGAVAGAFLVMALLFWVRPGEWAMLDWAIRSRLEAGFRFALAVIRSNDGTGVVTDAFEAQVWQMITFLGSVFPALLGLASLSALALAWWLYLRIGRGIRNGISSLRDFRFNDQLVWVFISGLLVLLLSSGLPERLGTNAVVFMGALYALRGVAVILFVTGGGSLLGGLLFLVAFFLVAPLILIGAMIIGLGDTWLDLRTRRRASSSA